MLDRRVLLDITLHAALTHTSEGEGICERGEDECAQVGTELTRGAGELQTVHAGKLKIDHDDVRAAGLDDIEGGLRRACRAREHEAILRGEPLGEEGAKHGLVLDDEDAKGLGFHYGCSAILRVKESVVPVSGADSA